MKAFKAFIKPSEAPQRSAKKKIHVDFFFPSGIETGKVKWENCFILCSLKVLAFKRWIS